MSDTTPNSSSDSSAPKSGGCLWAFVVIVIVLVGAGTAAFFYIGDPFKQLLSKVTGGFYSTQTTLKTEEILIEMGRTHGDVLEVASPMKTMETFSKADIRTAAWGWISLGWATSEIKVPVTYRFHIKLSEIKQVRLDDSVLIVTAPTVYPTLPVAFDTAGMEKKADGTWLRFDAPQQLADLEKSVTPALETRAQGHVSTVRENARRDIEEFVQNWIVDKHPDYRDKIKAVKVIFPGEDSRMTEKSTPVP